MATAVSGTQAVSGLVVVVGGLPFGQLLTAPCRYFCSTLILPLPVPPSPLQLTQSLSINFCLRFSVLRQSESEKRIRQCLTIALQLDNIYQCSSRTTLARGGRIDEPGNGGGNGETYCDCNWTQLAKHFVVPSMATNATSFICFLIISYKQHWTKAATMGSKGV